VDPSCVVTIGGGEDLDFYAPRDFEILGVVVEAHRLEAHARQVEHRDIQPVLRHPVLRPGGERAGALRSLLGSMLQSTEVNPAVLQHASTQRVLEETMLAAVVAVIYGEPPSPPGNASRRHVVDAAKAYMQARIAEPITVAELCRELGVSRRTLQYAFGEVLGTNAVAFLRALRLNGVRRDLRNRATGPREKVQDAAARWGFWHLGHFVTDYRRMFGELPSQTLSASRSAADKTVGGMRG
jgi:AraC family ethanolamine operon transcriptional activator